MDSAARELFVGARLALHEDALRSTSTGAAQLAVVCDLAADLEAQRHKVSADVLVRLCAAANQGDLPSVRPYGDVDFRGRSVDSLTSSRPVSLEAMPDLAGCAAGLRNYLVGRSLNVPPSLVTAYAALVSSEQVWRSLPLAQSLDLHEFAILAVERALGTFTATAEDATAEATVDQALFEWLHLLTHRAVPADWTEEAAQRRKIRVSNIDQPVVRVLAMICERRLPEDLLERILRVARGGELNWPWMFRGLGDLYRRETDQAGPWRERMSGFAAEERRFFTKGAADASLEWVNGNIWGWLTRRRVPLTLPAWELSQSYAATVVAVRESDRRNHRRRSVATYHLVAVRSLLRRGVELPLWCELGLLAWLTDQFNVTYSLQAFLIARERELAELDPE